MSKDKKTSLNDVHSSLKTPSIDSFKYRILLSDIDIVNQNILNEIHLLKVNTTTSEIIEEKAIQENSLKIISDCYQTHYVIANDFGTKYLKILINSKLLEHDYLDGISMKNIEIIYNQIQSHGVVHFHSLEEFLSKGLVSDIDIKKDIEVENEESFDVLTKELEKLTISSAKKNEGSNRFSKKYNKGIEWNERSKSTYNKPFLKIYHKGIESLNSKNFTFFDKYIDLTTIRNRVRIETTIRTTECIKKHGIKSATLLEVLKASEETLNNAVNKSLDNIIETVKEPKKIKPKQGMTPQEQLNFTLLTVLMNNHTMTFERALEYILVDFNDKVVRSRLKKKLTEIYQTYIKGLKFEAKAEKLEQFFKDIDFMNKYAV